MWNGYLERCRAGRALLEPFGGECDGVDRMWDAVARRCPGATDESLPTKVLAAAPGLMIERRRVLLNPGQSAYFGHRSTFDDLREGVGWVVVGERPPGRFLDVSDVGFELRSWTYDLPPEPCTVRLYVEADGVVGRVEPLTCPRDLFRTGWSAGVRHRNGAPTPWTGVLTVRRANSAVDLDDVARGRTKDARSRDALPLGR